MKIYDDFLIDFESMSPFQWQNTFKWLIEKFISSLSRISSNVDDIDHLCLLFLVLPLFVSLNLQLHDETSKRNKKKTWTIKSRKINVAPR